ncbi:hypothetical protein [Streptosporangium saharense]
MGLPSHHQLTSAPAPAQVPLDPGRTDLGPLPRTVAGAGTFVPHGTAVGH